MGASAVCAERLRAVVNVFNGYWQSQPMKARDDVLLVEFTLSETERVMTAVVVDGQLFIRADCAAVTTRVDRTRLRRFTNEG